MTSIEKRLTDALAPIGWPIFNGVYQGKAKSYIVLRHSDLPALPGDDRPGALRILVYVDIYCPLSGNPTATVNAVRRALYNAGMTYPTTEDASDADTRHIVLECEAIGCTGLDEPEETVTATEAAPAQAAATETGTATTAEVSSRWG